MVIRSGKFEINIQVSKTQKPQIFLLYFISSYFIQERKETRWKL